LAENRGLGANGKKTENSIIKPLPGGGGGGTKKKTKKIIFFFFFPLFFTFKGAGPCPENYKLPENIDKEIRSSLFKGDA